MERPEEEQRQRGPRSVTELAVELTVAWLRRVNDTADGRDPAEVVQAMEKFFSAIHEHAQHERTAQQERQPAGVH